MNRVQTHLVVLLIAVLAADLLATVIVAGVQGSDFTITFRLVFGFTGIVLLAGGAFVSGAYRSTAPVGGKALLRVPPSVQNKVFQNWRDEGLTFSEYPGLAMICGAVATALAFLTYLVPGA